MSQKGLEVFFALKKLDVKGSKLVFCNDCLFGKQVRKSYYASVSRKPNGSIWCILMYVASLSNLWAVLRILVPLSMIILGRFVCTS